MKFKLLLLPMCISLLTACGDDKDNNSPPTPAPAAPTTPKESKPKEAAQDSLLTPQSKGDVSQFGGATRLQIERTAAVKASLSDAKVKHVILFIGDGTSESEITAARNYAEGAAGYFKGLDVLPFTGAYTTYALGKGNSSINYVTDSAASATAWATGVKTHNNGLGIDTYGKPHQSILMLAKQAGFATGNVTTTELQDATPAALVSHIAHRRCYGPVVTQTRCKENALDNPAGNGLGSITEQMLKARADVTLGGGRKTFSERVVGGQYQGLSLLEQAKQEKYQVINTAAELKNIKKADQNQPVLGLFAEGNLPTLWSGPRAVLNGHKGEAIQCRANPSFGADVPTLKEMTSKAIELLKSNEKGFFLQVESGSIDKANHASNPCAQFGETVQLDEAIQVALAFAKDHPDTLIIVTGDHAHTSQIIPNSTNSPGNTQKLLTKDNVPMSINYGTSTSSSQTHTGAQVRTAAYGPRAANVLGLIDQTDLFFIMRDAMGLPKS
ncbi:alkaline phosphatase [Acinetobacter larvae]|uniref:Alkaline phosphatase n=1 Tax=Acinetobacter larvae TaxID=1789224 RepID=A0A1B2LXD5_9GAMM|nr:alkaline phosphatase [Acinetobacter larvae]AOA57433.1 alkaline phosphatase [Acinetobacter larvae]